MIARLQCFDELLWPVFSPLQTVQKKHHAVKVPANLSFCLYVFPVVISQARQIGHYLSHFNRGRNDRHFAPQVSFVQLVPGKRHLSCFGASAVGDSLSNAALAIKPALSSSRTHLCSDPPIRSQFSTPIGQRGRQSKSGPIGARPGCKKKKKAECA